VRLYPRDFHVDAVQPLLRHRATLEAVRAGRWPPASRDGARIVAPNLERRTPIVSRSRIAGVRAGGAGRRPLAAPPQQ
jgi:hypothetical protein